MGDPNKMARQVSLLVKCRLPLEHMRAIAAALFESRHTRIYLEKKSSSEAPQLLLDIHLLNVLLLQPLLLPAEVVALTTVGDIINVSAALVNLLLTALIQIPLLPLYERRPPLSWVIQRVERVELSSIDSILFYNYYQFV